MTQARDVWASGETDEPYVGRWSRLVARELVGWLAVPSGARWVDVGCGTGALTEAILAVAGPAAILAVDASEGHVAFARRRVADERVRFDVSDATALPCKDSTTDAAVSGLVLNLIGQPAQMVAEMVRAVRPGGIVAAYVWDHSGDMQLMRRSWDAAIGLDVRATEMDEGRRFPLSHPVALADAWGAAGLGDVEVRPIDVVTRFRDFDDYWRPFLGGQAPAPGYVASLGEERRAALREALRATVPTAPDGSIELAARAWAVRGRKS